MNEQHQRAAIAKACGLQNIDPKDWWGWDYEGIEMPGDMPIMVKIPDYLNDLNAMHKAEKAIDSGKLAKYTTELVKVCGGPMSVHFATAAQRAEAFLKALNIFIP